MESFSLAALSNGYCDFALANRGDDPAEQQKATAQGRQFLQTFVSSAGD